MSAKYINTVGHVNYVNIVQFQKSIRILLDFLSGLGLQKNVFHDSHFSISTGSFIKVLITLQTIIPGFFGPARAGPLYEIRIWEAYAFLRDECINWV